MACTKPYRTHCPSGHSIAEVGRDRSGRCRECTRVSNRKRTIRRRELLAKIKLDRGCGRCGYRKCPAALHFHHRDPESKAAGIGQIVCFGPERLREELAKCDLVCANCHAEIHWGAA